jgi:uncharacterized protein (DUF58 family)
MPARRTFFLLGVITLLLAAAAVVPWMAWLALLLDLFVLALFWIDLRRAAKAVLAVEREWPPLMVQGVEAVVVVRLRSQCRRKLRLILREGLHPAVATRPKRRAVELAGSGAIDWRYTLRPRRRGEHRLLPLTARLLGPWGLAWSQRELLEPEELRVYPQVRWEGKVGRLLLLAHRHQLGQINILRQGIGLEPYSLREYLPGDPLNTIHWKATARHGHPITREEALERGARLVILLDCARSMTSRDGERSKLDHALAAALALARVASARGDRVTVAAFAESVNRVVRLRGSRSMSRAYRELYDLQARLSEPAYDVAVELVSTLEARRATVMLFTSVVDLAAADLLKDALLHLERRHLPVLINLEDPELLRLALGEPDRPEEAFAKVSGLQILLENQRLARRLRRSGIRVVTAPADRLAIETLEAYLAMIGPRTGLTRR